ncbi:MAG TPA: PilZ domain-containing protein [Spirochaetia bacterium]|nr:PilZ domain-containing protein [Spirochaetia bacterium]
MSMVTTQQLTRYIEQYGQTEVTFTRQVINATGLVARGVYMKLTDRQIPCVVFSASMSAAKVIAGVKTAFFNALRQTGNKLSLRWCFKLPQEGEPITFFVSCQATGFTPYNPGNPDEQLITLEYAQRPPDDLIVILGNLLEATANSQRRRDERVTITPETMKKLGIESREAVLSINGRPYRGVLRDVSFGGAKILMHAVPQSASGGTVTMKISKGEQGGELLLLCTVRRIEKVGGRSDIDCVAVEYVRDTPLSYKLLINSYLSLRKGGAEAPAAQAPASHASTAPARGAPPAGAPAEADFPEEEGGEENPDG